MRKNKAQSEATPNMDPAMQRSHRAAQPVLTGNDQNNNPSISMTHLPTCDSNKISNPIIQIDVRCQIAANIDIR